ncbi:uncharacterized protein LOC106755441 [Vigna radiata var. radiata]|uniref:Uncharacterized protein LOC106755441 n=1 Tax=Vigna radiata var. radiata TaxID=3916 RepID=A0A1S3TH46_VIGRR|nr:uncharacterized protein LOC106755441 [Vigna radiata var. radiata]
MVEDIGRGLSDDDLESEQLLTPENSGSEEDNNADKPSRCPFPTFGKKKSMVDYKWEVGTIFNDKEDFKEAIRNYAIHTGRDLKFVKNDKRRVRVRCMDAQKKCPWLRGDLDQPRFAYLTFSLKTLPSSTVKIKVNSDNGEAIFERIYVCLNACKKSFVSCRPSSFLDGCFLKGLYKGELLTAVGRDPNDHMLPIAYAVVEVENKDSWSWFLQLLIEDLGGNEICRACTWMSDQQKGLVHAIEELLPKAEQRFCIRHLYANFRKQFSGQILKNLMWSAATSKFWSRSRFIAQASCDSLDNNISEGFNNVLIHARGKPIITLLEDIRLYLMKRWATNRMEVASMDFNVCPKIKKRLSKECQLSRYWIPSWSTRWIFEVGHVSAVGNKFTVDLDTHECGCRKWMISGIPCCHAVAAMHYINLDPDTFIPTWFMKSTYEETYASIICPMNGHVLWENTSFPHVLPPVKRKMPGRPKKKRRLESWELTKDGT